MFAATGGSGPAGVRRASWNLRAVSGDKSLFRQWRQKFTTALGQIGDAHEEIVRRLVKEIDLGKDMGKVVTGLRGEYGDEFDKVLGDV